MILRNVVPRQGTEIEKLVFCCIIFIEKCSSPTGDGNVLSGTSNIDTLTLRNVVPRQGTEIVLHYQNQCKINFIEKCSSPTGDGNSVPYTSLICCICSLRNVVPRQGTEIILSAHTAIGSIIEKCSSPTGDGNLLFLLLNYNIIY